MSSASFGKWSVASSPFVLSKIRVCMGRICPYILQKSQEEEDRAWLTLSDSTVSVSLQSIILSSRISREGELNELNLDQGKDPASANPRNTLHLHPHHERQKMQTLGRAPAEGGREGDRVTMGIEDERGSEAKGEEKISNA